MGLHSSGSNIIKLTDTFGNADPMVEWVNSNLTVPPCAGWTHVRRLTSEITFGAFAIVSGNLATLDGNGYKFYSPPGIGNVLIGASLQETLNTWGAVVNSIQHWSFLVTFNGTNWQIRFFDIPYPGNNLFCNILPTGNVGLYDFIVDGTGTGRTWGGGHEVKTAIHSGNPLQLKLTTVNTIGAMAITPEDDAISIKGVNVATGSWTLLANKYQMFLFVSGGGGTPQTFLFAGHLYPVRGLSFFNYITGPGIVDGGDRNGFSDALSSLYYCSTGVGFSGSGNSNASKNPTVTIPVNGRGVGSKTGNPLSGLPIKDDQERMIPFDAMLAAPVLPGGDIRNVGWFWDALIYSNFITQDTGSCTINEKIGHPIISQAGGDPFKSNSPGTLVIQAEP